jgi:site-specific recombinase XerD
MGILSPLASNSPKGENMIDAIYSRGWLIQRLRRGLLGSHIDRFATLLLEQGYAPDTTEKKIKLVADLGRWLEGKRRRLIWLDEEKVEAFLRTRQRRPKFRLGERATMRLLLDQLRSSGDLPAPRPKPEGSSLDFALGEYTDYLVRERGLSQRTVGQYTHWIRTFLAERFDGRAIRLNALCQADTNRHLQRKSTTVCPTTLHGVTAALRSYFTFLHLRGDIQTNLASGVPAVACWRLSTVPKFLKPNEVQQLLDSCDQATTKGQRDYTILLLLARLGLRAGELVAMRLDDINWDAGEMLIRGKGQRHDRLPIPKDVGQALANYLRHGRPRSLTRHVFVRLNAPHRGFVSSSDISTIVRQAVNQAGLHPPNKGDHLLRHSLATNMLQRGASLTEIGEVLRHRCPITTELYSKVDLGALHALARPWPEGKS